jgi:hypothetical protein
MLSCRIRALEEACEGASEFIAVRKAYGWELCGLVDSTLSVTFFEVL